MNHKKLGIYIHIPFCVAKCNYCDFNSFASDDKTKVDYINALCSEIKVYGPQFNDYTVDTVFIGGGTPSILPAVLTAKFMDCLRSNFNIDGGAEISMEANPGTLVILVRDLMQGDLTSVNTLSGGESFMVSLALALALSSTTGKMFSMDTLFIDEGFGSLSEDYLGKVMETLNRLYDIGGRRVGIISHVESLKDPITTHIQVERDGNNNTVSRITVKG